MSKKAFITGILGQDGSYLAELLLKKGYEIYGFYSSRSIPNFRNVNHIQDRVIYYPGNMTDKSSLDRALESCKPDEIYNLAAQSFIPDSWNYPIYTSEVNYLGTLNLLEAMRTFVPKAKFYQASSSEMYGNSYPIFHPVSPYGVSKLAAHETVRNYRETYDLFTCSGICFNHESPRRGEHFVTQKIVQAAVRIKAGLQDKLELGNLEAERDFGHAKDYVYAMWLMLQNDWPVNYEIATGETYSIVNILNYVFTKLKLNWGKYVRINDKFKRLHELHKLKGNPSAIKIELEWYPKYTFETLFDEMIEYAQKEL